MSDPQIFGPDDDIPKLKTAFAEALLRTPDNAFGAGTAVFGAQTTRALFAASQWINDAFVLSEKSRLLRTAGARAFLPTKEDYAREVWKLATEPKVAVEDRARLLSLYGDVMGFKETAHKNTGGISVTANRVMLVTHHGDDGQWEAAAKAQQARLTRADADVTDVAPRIQ